MAQDTLATGAAALNLFDNVLQTFQTASSARAPITCDYWIADFGVRLCFAGNALVPGLSSVFSPCAVDALTSPDLTICIWDSASTHTSLPNLNSRDEWAAWRGDFRDMKDDRIRGRWMAIQAF